MAQVAEMMANRAIWWLLVENHLGEKFLLCILPTGGGQHGQVKLLKIPKFVINKPLVKGETSSK